MGLAERRAAEKFRTEQFPVWQQRIDEAAGFGVEVEVDWAALAVPNFTEQYDEFFGKVYFRPLVDALSGVTVDQLGKDALREGLSKVVVKNSGEYYSPSSFSFSSGVLTIDHRPDANVDDVKDRTTHTQKLLEDAL